MANLTKEQRAEKEAQLRAEIKAEIMAELRAELEAEVKAEILAKEESLKQASYTEKKQIAKSMQKTVRIPLDTIVPVTCNYKGGLKYVSKRTSGFMISWDGYGSTEYIELSELSSMRNSDRRFFEDNWIVIEDTDEYTAMQIYDFLKIAKYYKNVFTPENIDTIFEKDAADIVTILSTLSKGMRDTIAVRAKEKIEANELDSNSKIKALEEALGMKFNIFDV